MFYIIGLGNPGEKYQNTRHNVGRIILENFAKTEEFSQWSKSKGANALYTYGSLEREDIELLLPETFMNNSGQSVLYLQRKHDVSPSHIVIVYDDVDLPFGQIKISKGRGAGGHNGIESIIKALGTKDFIRIRIGVSGTSFWTGKMKRPHGAQMAKYVLGRFSKSDMNALIDVTAKVRAVLVVLSKEGVEQAMNQTN